MKIPTKVRLALPAAAALLGVLVSAIASAQLPVGVGMDSYGRYYSCFAPGGSYNNPISAMLSGQGQIM